METSRKKYKFIRVDDGEDATYPWKKRILVPQQQYSQNEQKFKLSTHVPGSRVVNKAALKYFIDYVKRMDVPVESPIIESLVVSDEYDEQKGLLSQNLEDKEVENTKMKMESQNSRKQYSEARCPSPASSSPISSSHLLPLPPLSQSPSLGRNNDLPSPLHVDYEHGSSPVNSVEIISIIDAQALSTAAAATAQTNEQQSPIDVDDEHCPSPVNQIEIISTEESQVHSTAAAASAKNNDQPSPIHVEDKHCSSPVYPIEIISTEEAQVLPNDAAASAQTNDQLLPIDVDDEHCSSPVISTEEAQVLPNDAAATASKSSERGTSTLQIDNSNVMSIPVPSQPPEPTAQQDTHELVDSSFARKVESFRLKIEKSVRTINLKLAHHPTATVKALKVELTNAKGKSIEKRLTVIQNLDLLEHLFHWLQRCFDDAPIQKEVLELLALATCIPSTQFRYSYEIFMSPRKSVSDEKNKDTKESSSCNSPIEVQPHLSPFQELMRLIPVASSENCMQVFCIISHLMVNGGLPPESLVNEWHVLDLLLPRLQRDNDSKSFQCIRPGMFMLYSIWENINLVKHLSLQDVQRILRVASILICSPKCVPQVLVESCELLLVVSSDVNHKKYDELDREALKQYRESCFGTILKDDQLIRKLIFFAKDFSVVKVAEKSLQILKNLSLCSNAALTNTMVGQLAIILRERIQNQKTSLASQACRIICELTNNSGEEYCRLLVRLQGMVPALLRLLEDVSWRGRSERTQLWKYAAYSLLGFFKYGYSEHPLLLCCSDEKRLIRTICCCVLSYPDEDEAATGMATRAVAESIARLEHDKRKMVKLVRLWKDQAATRLLTSLLDHKNKNIVEGARQALAALAAANISSNTDIEIIIID